MVQADHKSFHSDGLPWWLFDMRPQGYLGRAYASTYASGLGLPANPEQWADADVVRALLAQGHDAIGNLLIGEQARSRFLKCPNRLPWARRRIPNWHGPQALVRCRAHLRVVSSPNSAPIPNAVMCW